MLCSLPVRKPAALAFAASLSACASVNPAGLARLAALDPLNADPQQISVAARLPQALKLRTGDLIMVVKSGAAAGTGEIDETFLLAVSDAAAGSAGAIAPQAGERLQTARVAPQDIERLRAAQAKARAIKAAGGAKGNGSLTVAAKGGCKTAAPSGGDLVMNLYMQTQTNGEWFPVVSALDLRWALGAELLAQIPAC